MKDKAENVKQLNLRVRSHSTRSKWTYVANIGDVIEANRILAKKEHINISSQSKKGANLSRPQNDGLQRCEEWNLLLEHVAMGREQMR